MKKIIYVIALFTSVMQAQVGIGTTTPSGALEVNSAMPLPSTQKAGLVPPTVELSATNSTVTTTAGVSVINPLTNGVPTTGTIVYNTYTSAAGANQVTPGYYYWDGTLWQSLKTSKNTITLNQSISAALTYTQGRNLAFGQWIINGWNSATAIERQYILGGGSGIFYSPTTSYLTNFSLNGSLFISSGNYNVEATIYVMKYSLGTANSIFTSTVTGDLLGSQTIILNTTNTVYPVSIPIPDTSVLPGDLISCWIVRTGGNTNNSRTFNFTGQLQFDK